MREFATEGLNRRGATMNRRQFVMSTSAAVLATNVLDTTLPHAFAVQQKERSKVEIQRNGAKPSTKGPADWFTGSVRIDSLFPMHEPARAAGAAVTFEPGARTTWHTHPLGQTLIVTSGVGRVQKWGGPIEEIWAGDVVWFPPGEKHWHGAAPLTAMTHIAIQESLEGKVVDWMEHVTDEQYGK
jgi:quercetin dioxygenase-like cupin family protein